MTVNLCDNSASTGVTHYTVWGSEDRSPNEMLEKIKRPQACERKTNMGYTKSTKHNLIIWFIDNWPIIQQGRLYIYMTIDCLCLKTETWY